MNLEKIMGPGLAAPETAAIRRLRWTVIVLSAAVVIGLLAIGLLRRWLGPVATGGCFAVLLAATASVGAVYFRLKARRDDEWLDQQCARGGEQ